MRVGEWTIRLVRWAVVIERTSDVWANQYGGKSTYSTQFPNGFIDVYTVQRLAIVLQDWDLLMHDKDRGLAAYTRRAEYLLDINDRLDERHERCGTESITL